MKIIGKTNSGFILEAKASEMAHLIGFYSEFKAAKYLEIGNEIEINHMYNQLYELSHMEKEIQQIADKLEKYATELRPLVPVKIDCPTKGNKKVES